VSRLLLWRASSHSLTPMILLLIVAFVLLGPAGVLLVLALWVLAQ